MDSDHPVIRGLTSIVGANNVLTRPEIKIRYERDWSGRFVGTTPAVVRPGDTAQTAAVLQFLAARGLPVVPQGGNTGLVGGGVPLNNEIVLSLERQARVENIDKSTLQVTAGAGATIAQVQAAARRAGFDFGIDIASRDSATVGGAISTNAGGLRVPKFGPMSAQVVGIEAVLSDGGVLTHLVGLTKDNTGYSFEDLFAGAEGTLGVITRARLRLVPSRSQRILVLFGLGSVREAVDITRELRLNSPSLEAAELMLEEGIDAVVRSSELSYPFPERPPVYLLVEAAGGPAEVAQFADSLPSTQFATMAQDSSDHRRLWRYREAHTESISRLGVPVKMDVTVPLNRYAEFTSDVGCVVRDANPTSQLVRFGHISDGNLHVNVIAHKGVRGQVENAVYELVAAYEGSVSSEHGIGRAKLPWLHLSRSDSEIAAAKRIRQALDPAMVMNPHVLYI